MPDSISVTTRTLLFHRGQNSSRVTRCQSLKNNNTHCNFKLKLGWTSYLIYLRAFKKNTVIVCEVLWGQQKLTGYLKNQVALIISTAVLQGTSWLSGLTFNLIFLLICLTYVPISHYSGTPFWPASANSSEQIHC